ncbi:MAG: hypothetical protein IKN77_11080 [Paludibacteraceae bacterium]|nr:hypothetical protein [Paludibacteraceae bacterium]
MICPSLSGWHGTCALSLPQGGAVGLYLLQPFRLIGTSKYCTILPYCQFPSLKGSYRYSLWHRHRLIGAFHHSLPSLKGSNKMKPGMSPCVKRVVR